MPTKKITARVKVGKREGTIVGSEFPKGGSGSIRWKVKFSSGKSEWFDDSKVKAI